MNAAGVVLAVIVVLAVAPGVLDLLTPPKQKPHPRPRHRRRP